MALYSQPAQLSCLDTQQGTPDKLFRYRNNLSTKMTSELHRESDRGLATGVAKPCFLRQQSWTADVFHFVKITAAWVLKLQIASDVYCEGSISSTFPHVLKLEARLPGHANSSTWCTEETSLSSTGVQQDRSLQRAILTARRAVLEQMYWHCFINSSMVCEQTPGSLCSGSHNKRSICWNVKTKLYPRQRSLHAMGEPGISRPYTSAAEASHTLTAPAIFSLYSLEMTCSVSLPPCNFQLWVMGNSDLEITVLLASWAIPSALCSVRNIHPSICKWRVSKFPSLHQSSLLSGGEKKRKEKGRGSQSLWFQTVVLLEASTGTQGLCLHLKRWIPAS